MALVRAVVGGKVAAAPINAIIDEVEQAEKHAEFTAVTGGLASGTLGVVGTLAFDMSKTTDATFVTPGLSTLTINETGVFAIDFSGTIPTPPTGVFWVRLYDGTNYPGIISSPGLAQIGGSLVSTFHVTAGTVLNFQWWHVSAASRVLTSRTRISRIS